jgi:hypothetical protein
MANYRAIATGNWNSLAIWQDDSSGGYQNSTVLPSTADIVYSNNFIVTLNVDIDVQKLSNIATTGVNVGGDFAVSVNRQIVANIESGNNWCLRVVNGNVSVNINVFVYGNIVSGNAAAIYGRSQNVNTVNLVIYGNVTPNNEVAGIDIAGTGAGRQIAITIFGNSAGMVVNNLGLITLISVNLTGVFTAGAFDCFPSVRDTFTAVGILTASATNNVCVGATTCVANITGVINNINSRMAVVFNSMYLNPTTSLVWNFYDINNDIKPLYTAEAFDPPDESDVRDGVVYGAGSLTGTLETEEFLALPVALKERLEKVATTEEVGTIWAG